MRLNLNCGDDIIFGYVNIDAHVNHPQVQRGDFRDLRTLNIEDGSITEIVAKNTIRNVDINSLAGVLHQWCDLLEPGGELYIVDNDITLLGNHAGLDEVEIEEINGLLFSGRETPRGVYNLATIENALRKLGLTLLEKGYTGYQFFIRAKK
jgi:hypothetical protein